jgi:proteasome-associated ATPase
MSAAALGRVAEIIARARQNGSASKTAEQLLVENMALRGEVDKARIMLQEMREEMDKLTAPEHYLGVITAVEWGEPMHVEVHVIGMSPVRAEVHPSVDQDQVRVGAVGYLSRTRNCLMDARDETPPWKDVGVFEEYFDDDRRILVRHQEQLVALALAESLFDEPLVRGDRVGFDGHIVGMAYVRLPAAETGHLFAEDVPTDDFARLGGLDKQIATLKRAIGFRLQHADVARRYRLSEKQGILLDGPPGNGKTCMARCAASYVTQLTGGAPCRFMSVTGSEVYSMWLGGSEAQLKQRFEAVAEAAKSGPVVMFFDEIDAIGRRRGTDHGSAAPDRILATFLGFLDDVERKLANVIIIAATNRADQLDPGLTRPGRLSLKMTVPPPNRRAAECILRRYLGDGLPIVGPIDELALPLVSAIYSPRGAYAELATVKLSDGRQLSASARELVSGATLEHVVRQAAEAAAAREVESGRADGITGEDLAEALDGELSSVARLLSPANVKAYVRSIPSDSHPVDVRTTLGRRGLHVRSA